MPAVTTKAGRVALALQGGKPDRVPVSAWWHDYAREWSAQALAEATLEAYRRYDWDFVKVNPRFSYYAEDWGTRFRFSGRPDVRPEFVEAAVKGPADLRRIGPLDVTKGAYGEQLEALRLIARELRNEAPFVQTVFSPLAVMSFLTDSPTAVVQQLMREHSHELMTALNVIAETLAAYSRASLEAGASGIFFATVVWGSADNISPDDYDRFARPFDLQVLQAVRDAGFNVLHVCGGNNHLSRLIDYPVTVFHWDEHAPGNPSLAEARKLTSAALMGGVSHGGSMATGTPDDVTKEARAAIEQTGGEGFLLAPGCSIDPGVPEANRRALAEAVRA
jgi:uroporphyrinogen decarboxylase